MAYANISFEIPQDHVTEINNYFNEITARLPFMVNLSADERQSVPKMNDTAREKVIDVQFALTNHAHIFPASFNAPEFARDVNLLERLEDFELRLLSLAEKLTSTKLALGGEVVKAARQGYQFVQTASKTEPGIQNLAAKMKAKYKNNGKKKKKGEG